ncbi:MAG: hypothetical protein J5851_09830 [Oscillospiraceae bacterium]|nr:hypothetical protein [Oscillospiraceae bacterium]
MGFADLFRKKTNYFDKKITPQCAYCQYGKRTKDGANILCEKTGLQKEDHSCRQFTYSPLKRIPVKQLKNEGALAEEEMYVEINEEEQAAKLKAMAEARAKEEAEAKAKIEAEARAKVEAEVRAKAEAEAKARAEAEAKARAEAEEREKAEAEAKAKAEAEAKAKAEAEAKEKEEAEIRAKAVADAKAKVQAAAAKAAAEAKAQDARAMAEAIEKAQTAAPGTVQDGKAMADAIERAKAEAEAQARAIEAAAGEFDDLDELDAIPVQEVSAVKGESALKEEHKSLVEPPPMPSRPTASSLLAASLKKSDNDKK